MIRSLQISASCSVLLLLAMAGCGGSQSSTAPPPPPIGQIYVVKANEGTVLRFHAGDSGNVAPQIKISSQTHPNNLTFDVAHDRLAGTSFDGVAVVMLVDNVSTFTGGVRLISGAATAMKGPGFCALDGTADLLYVLDNGSIAGGSSILVFGPASTASGNVAPVHAVLLPYLAVGIAVDPANNRLFVTDSTNNVINVYDSASTLDGVVAPSRTIGGTATQLAPVGPLAFESSGHLLVGSPFSNSNNGSAVRVFSQAGSINGNVAPNAVFSLANSTMVQIAVTPAGDLYVVNLGPQIAVYSNVFTATGTISPTRIITGSLTDLDSNILTVPPLVSGIAIDPTR